MTDTHEFTPVVVTFKDGEVVVYNHVAALAQNGPILTVYNAESNPIAVLNLGEVKRVEQPDLDRPKPLVEGVHLSQVVSLK